MPNDKPKFKDFDLKRNILSARTVELSSRFQTFLIAIYIFSGLQFSGCTNNSAVRPADGPSPALTPAQELATFQISPELKVQLVAAEPLVQDPVVITFDPDGRLWVVEMRGYMPDINGKGENEPVGRVSVLEDTNYDGQMDASRIYIDSLIMPRALALVAGGALIVENSSLWLTQDVDGDLQADTKTLIDSSYAGGTNPEHSANGLLRNMDNWYYNAKSRFRYRLIAGTWQRDSTEFRGQWGISQDDQGRLYYNYNWSQLHADLVPPNYLSRNKNHTSTTGIDHGLTIDRRVYPVRPNPAVNRGYIPGTLDEKGRLLEFTAACSPFYYRGTALSKEYYGNVFVCEPAGNLIKRNIVEEKDLMLKAHDPTPGKEFLASTDERFRPVYLTSGPDGALYVADMYRGLVEHGAFVTPYLREQTIKRKLVQPVNCGRIWRIVPKDWEPSSPIRFSGMSSEELINILSHPNGWHRDVAQRLLVERADSVSQLLTSLARKSKNQLGRLHALWTLEGLNLVTPTLLFDLLHDQDLLVSTAALRLLEPKAKANRDVRVRLAGELVRIWQDAPMEKILQIALSASVLEPEQSQELLQNIVQRFDTSALIRDAVLSSLHNQEFAFLKKLWNVSSWQKHEPAREIFIEMLTSAIFRKRDTKELAALVSMLDTKHILDWKQQAVLTAISIQGKNKTKPVQLASVPAVLTRKQIQNDRLLAPLKKVFEWPGNKVANVEDQVQKSLSESDLKQFVLGRQHYLTTCAGCHGTDGAGVRRFAPPLIGSDWVLGNKKRLVLLVLHGIEGPMEVNGKRYDAPDILPVMPAHSTLDDASISSILTYIRNEWGHAGGPVSRGLVGSTRHTSQGRVTPWTVPELNKHISELKEPDDH